MNTKPATQSKKVISTDSLIEQLRDVGSGVKKTIQNDLIGGIASDALSSLLGSPKPQGGDMQPGEAISMPNRPKQTAENRPFPFARREARAPMNNYLNESIQALRRQEALVAQKIEEIRQEIKALIVTMRQVDKEIEKAAHEELIDPDLYHLTFLDRIKTMLKVVRKNLSESASWLSVMRSRKKQRSYWSMYKKKGTEFGLNNERTVATQVG